MRFLDHIEWVAAVMDRVSDSKEILQDAQDGKLLTFPF